MSRLDPILRDTTPDAAGEYYRALRKMRPVEKVWRSLELSDELFSVLESGVRHRHPEYDPPRAREAAVRLRLGDCVPISITLFRPGGAVAKSTSFLQWLVGSLDRAAIPYMIAGSLASTFYGEHRATADVDVVIDPSESQLLAFLDALGEEFYVSREAARDALRGRFMFNVIHPGAGFKADLVIRKDRPFSREEFSRRRQVDLLGSPVYVVSPEDSILSKLEWSKEGESERQFRDALGVAVVQWPDLDVPYLRRWGRELGVEDLLERILSEARKRAISE